MDVNSESRPSGGFEMFHEIKPCMVRLIYVNARS